MSIYFTWHEFHIRLAHRRLFCNVDWPRDEDISSFVWFCLCRRREHGICAHLSMRTLNVWTECAHSTGYKITTAWARLRAAFHISVNAFHVTCFDVLPWVSVHMIMSYKCATHGICAHLICAHVTKTVMFNALCAYDRVKRGDHFRRPRALIWLLLASVVVCNVFVIYMI